MGKIRVFTAFQAAKFTATKKENGLPTLTGYAMVWNTLSSDRGGYQVKLLPGSAQPQPGGVRALFNHDEAMLLATTANGTLTCEADDYGMKVTIDPCDTSYGRDVCALVSRGDMGGMSFGMSWNDTMSYCDKVEAGVNIREFSAFQFDEITVTAIPAFDDTSIEAAFNAIAPGKVVPIRVQHALTLEEMRFKG